MARVCQSEVDFWIAKSNRSFVRFGPLILLQYITRCQTDFHGTLPMPEDLELRQTDIVADAYAVEALVPLVAYVPHGVTDCKNERYASPQSLLFFSIRTFVLFFLSPIFTLFTQRPKLMYANYRALSNTYLVRFCIFSLTSFKACFVKKLILLYSLRLYPRIRELFLSTITALILHFLPTPKSLGINWHVSTVQSGSYTDVRYPRDTQRYNLQRCNTKALCTRCCWCCWQKDAEARRAISVSISTGFINARAGDNENLHFKHLCRLQPSSLLQYTLKKTS